MVLKLTRKTYRNTAQWIAAVGLAACVSFGCQELPTEPTPIDLSKDQPVANDDVATTPEETLVRIHVLANDSSRVDDDLSLAEILTPPDFGIAEIKGDVIEYTPELDYNGSDSLRYRVSGSVLSSSATVRITVSPVNDPPVAVDDAFTIDESIAIPKAQSTVLDVLANDTDVEGDVLRVIKTSVPAHGSVQVASDGFSVSYEPTANFNGNDQFTYTISDGNAGQDLATVTVTIRPVNDPPVVTNKSYGTREDESRVESAPGVLAGASDPEGDALTAVLVTDVRHGSLSLMSDGSFVYEPAANYSGSDSFEFAASDGMSQSARATATINVIPVNDPPVASPDDYNTDEDVSLDVAAPGVLANDVDIDGDNLNLTLVTSVSHGQLELHADGSFTYLPDAGYSGSDGFEYQIDDGTLASQALVTITIGAVNDVPVASPDQYDVAANVDLVVPPPGVLENDSDEEGDVLTAQLVGSPQGMISLEGNGGFVYSPPPGFSGTDTFSYRASDGSGLSNTANVVILVTAQGNPPVAADDEYVMTVNDTLEVAAPGVLDNDSDLDDDELTAVLVDDVAEGVLELGEDGGLVYVPPEDFVGVATFTYRASDGANVSGVAHVTISVEP
ncbi:MAG: Ig-like domain-containing protein [Rhodothermales bacterium]